MPLYLYTAQYTAESLATQVKQPVNRAERTRVPVERLGGKLIGAWHAVSDPVHFVAIIEMSTEAAMASLALAFGAGGAAREHKWTPLLTPEQWVAALQHAGDTGYQPAVSQPEAPHVR
ncbi:MAG: GYD domain-containing protein [Dehalococcoidia bacterium]|nr:GYD domain-containing protein [Dehalococcoidia bacterium]